MYREHVSNISRKYFAINERFAKRTACKQQTAECAPTFGRFAKPSGTHGIRSIYVRCSNHSLDHDENHFIKVFRPNEQIDWELLESYYKGTIDGLSKCYRIETMSTRTENCGKTYYKHLIYISNTYRRCTAYARPWQLGNAGMWCQIPGFRTKRHYSYAIRIIHVTWYS